MTTVTIAPLVLRDYQQACLGSIQSYVAQGDKRLLVALPTGVGKTVIFAQLPHISPGRMLVIP